MNTISLKNALKYILFFFLISTISRGQSIDSLHEALRSATQNDSLRLFVEISHAFVLKTPDSCIFYASEAEKHPDFHDNPSLKAQIYYQYGMGYMNLRKFKKSLSYLEKSLEIFNELNDTLWTSRVYNRFANNYQYLSDYRQSYVYYQKALRLLKNTDQKKDKASVLSSLSNIYRLFGDHEKAIQALVDAQNLYEEINYQEGFAWVAFLLSKYYKTMEDYESSVKQCKKSLKIYEDMAQEDSIYIGVVMSLTMLSETYREMGRIDSALYYNFKTIEISKEHEIMTGLADGYSNLGKSYYSIEKYHESIQFLNKALEVKDQINDRLGICSSRLTLSKNYSALNLLDKARANLDSSYVIARKNNFNIYLTDIFLEYSLIFEKEKRCDSALHYYRKHTHLNDSIKSLEVEEKVAGLRLKFETEQKEKENIILKKNNEIQQQTITRQRTYIIFTIFLLFITTLSIINFINDKNKLKKANSKLESKNQEINQKNHIISEKNDSLNSINKELEEKNDRLYKLTIKDELTKIYNRKFLFKSLKKEITRCQRYKYPMGLLMIDIDHFKSINDTFGHLVGDFILKSMANEISSIIRDEDVFGRYGGEEFLVILPHTDGKQALTTAEKIRKQIKKTLFTYKEEDHSITISCGVSEFIPNKQDTDIDSIIKSADDALYEAKNKGRDQSVLNASYLS